jgi:hypothetical protein
MFPRISVMAILATVAGLGSLPACAVAASDSPSRAEVKAQTRAAQRAGQLTPAGEGFRRVAPQPASTKTRAARKAEALQARRAGEFQKAGLEPEWKAARAAARVPSTTTRAQRKAATLAAARAGQLTPAGEGVKPRN